MNVYIVTETESDYEGSTFKIVGVYESLKLARAYLKSLCEKNNRLLMSADKNEVYTPHSEYGIISWGITRRPVITTIEAMQAGK